MDDIYMYEGHKSWYWMFQLSIAISKGTQRQEEEVVDAIMLASEVMHDEKTMWSDKLMRDRFQLWSR